MKKFIIIILTIFIFLSSISQASVFENIHSIKIEKNNISIIFSKDYPFVSINLNGTEYNLIISSILFGNRGQIFLKDIMWHSSFLTLKNGVMNYKMTSNFYEDKININYFILNGQKMFNYSGYGLLINIIINGPNQESIIIFEHLVKGNISNSTTLKDVLNIHAKSRIVGFNRIKYSSNNQSLYISSSNGTEESFYQILQNSNGTVESNSFISFGSLTSVNLLNSDAIIYSIIGIFIGLIFIIMGIFFLRKKD